MSAICLEQTALHKLDAKSDKLYIVQLEQHDLPSGAIEYRAMGYYARRGRALTPTLKKAGRDLGVVKAEAVDVIREKLRDGYGYYTIPPSGIPGMPFSAPVYGGPASVGTPVPTPATPVASVAVGIVPMRANVLDEADLEHYLTDPDWAAQRKYDGERAPVSMRRSGLTATNLKGVVRGLTTGAERLLKKALAQPDFNDSRETIVDGEIMGDEYIVYDVVTLRDNDVRAMPYYERYGSLEVLFGGQPALVAPTAWTTEEKRAMLAQARRENWEGLIFRQVSGTYVNGRTSVILKFKLWAMATCRVLTANAQRSIQVALRDEDGSERPVGNVTVPPNVDVPVPDSLVEVRYLYALDGGSLYQPTLWRVRDDVDDADLRSSLRKAPPEKRGEGIAAVAA